MTEWRGFPAAVNHLLRAIPSEVYVVIGDDMHPDPYHTGPEILAQFKDHFGGTFGVMQPTGDRYGSIDTCAIAPWIGREFVFHMGFEVYHEGYFHYFSDAELYEVATRKGCYWARPDLVQYHDHWGRVAGAQAPAHLEQAQGNWHRDRRTYHRRKKDDFGIV